IRATALLRSAIPVGGATRFTKPPTETLGANVSGRAVAVRAAFGHARPFAGRRATSAPGASADHPAGTVGVAVRLAAVLGETGPRSADAPGAAIRVLPTRGDAAQQNGIAGLREAAARAPRHAFAQLANLIDAVHAIGVSLA